MRLFKWLCPFLYVLLLLQSVNAAGCADIKGKTERLSCIKTQNAARQNAFRSNYSGVKLSKSVQTTKTLPGQQKQAAAVGDSSEKIHQVASISANNDPTIGGLITEAFEKMFPLFEVMGRKSVLCGLPGSGQAAKACNNMLLATTMIGVGESLSLGNKLGLDSEKLFEILSTSTGSCWAINNYFPIKGVGPKSPADNNFKPGFSANLMLKDLTIALTAIAYSKTLAPFGTKAQENFKKMVEKNKGDLDFSAITKFNK